MKTLTTGLGGSFIHHGIQPGAEKISFSLGQPGIHYTGIVHGRNGLFDFHRTYDDPQASVRHEKLFEMSVFKLLRKLARISETFQPLLFEFVFQKRLNLGKIVRNGSILLSMDPPQDSADTFGKMRSNGRYYRFHSEIPVTALDNMIVYPEVLHGIPPGGYLLYRWKHRKLSYEGFLFRRQDDTCDRSLYFVSRKKWRSVMNQFQVFFEKEFASE